MSLAHKLHKIGQQVSKEDIKEIIEVKKFKEKYRTIQINFKKGIPTLNPNAMNDKNRTMFTKKIGGTSNSYYLYPNFEYQKENDLYKKFKAIAYTFENSVMLYANDKNQKIAKPIWEYIKNYKDDVLGLSKNFEKDNYFLIITIDGKTIYELMPEIWDNYYENFVDAHISKKVKKINTPQLKEEMDFITHKKEICGYNPNVKFFTMDNYNDAFKPQIIDKLPMSKETAIAIKKGWMYAIKHLKFYHKGLEYIIIPSMIDFDDEVYKKLLKYLKNSNSIKQLSAKEYGFVKRLSKQIETFDNDKINAISFDIFFTEVNPTNLSVKIFATLEDVIPSRINKVVNQMKDFQINQNIKREENSKETYLRDYFSREELFAISTKNTVSMKSRILQEKIYLAKLLLGYEQLNYKSLLKRFEFEREYDYEHKKRLSNMKRKDENNKEIVSPVKTKDWINYSNSFVTKEDKVMAFLEAINSIQ